MNKKIMNAIIFFNIIIPLLILITQREISNLTDALSDEIKVVESTSRFLDSVHRQQIGKAILLSIQKLTENEDSKKEIGSSIVRISTYGCQTAMASIPDMLKLTNKELYSTYKYEDDAITINQSFDEKEINDIIELHMKIHREAFITLNGMISENVKKKNIFNWVFISLSFVLVLLNTIMFVITSSGNMKNEK